MKVRLQATRILVAAFLGAIAVLYLTPLHVPLPDSKLDTSWRWVINWAAAKPLQFGQDIIFTYGPLGHLLRDIYIPKLFLPNFVARTSINILFLVMLFVLSARLRVLRRIGFVLISILVAFYNMFAAYLFMIVVAAWLAFAAPDYNRVLLILGLVFMAVASLMKETYLILAFTIILLGLIYLIWRRDLNTFALAFLAFTSAFIAAWLFAGQRLSGIPAFFWSSFDIIRGYNSAMSTGPQPTVLALGLAGLILGNLQIAAALVRCRHERGAWFTSLLLAMALFSAWKLGYTRADGAHTTQFFLYGVMAVVALPIFYVKQTRTTARFVDYPTVIVTLACCVFVMHDQIKMSFSNIFLDARNRVAMNLKFIVHPASVRARFEQEYEQYVRAFVLPQIERIVGQDTTDVFGREQAVAICNHLNYTPRPIFQGYSVYTPFLSKTNASFYRSARAPKWVIFKLQTIDARIPALDDADSLLVLAVDYYPVLTENGYTLLERKPDAPRSSEFRMVSAGEVALGDSISVPRGAIWCQLQVRETLLGKVIGFLFQLPKIRIEFEGLKDRLPPYRVVPLMAANGFLINPLLQTDLDFLNFLNGDYQEMEIRAVKIQPPVGAKKWFFQPRVTYRFSEIIRVR